jgi:hypothetical protein
MNIECLNSKIENATGTLQPTIMKAIKLLYQEWNSIITARMISSKCFEINNNVNWSARLPAICNAMRNTLECGGLINGEDRDYMGLTISYSKTQSVSKNESSTKVSIKSISAIKTIPHKTITPPTKQENIYDIERLKNDKIPKLLIIGCSDSKVEGGRRISDNNVNFNQRLNLLRIERRKFYNQLFENNPEHFLKNGSNLIKRYRNAINNENDKLMQAYLRYAGKYFTRELQEKYLSINQKNNFHILIISGLYGVLGFRDKIIDYHLKIDAKDNIWMNNTINESVVGYKTQYRIDDRDVYYSISGTYTEVLRPYQNWNDLWQNRGRGIQNLVYSAQYLNEFLGKI